MLFPVYRECFFFFVLPHPKHYSNTPSGRPGDVSGNYRCAIIVVAVRTVLSARARSALTDQLQASLDLVVDVVQPLLPVGARRRRAGVLVFPRFEEPVVDVPDRAAQRPQPVAGEFLCEHAASQYVYRRRASRYTLHVTRVWVSSDGAN